MKQKPQCKMQKYLKQSLKKPSNDVLIVTSLCKDKQTGNPSKIEL